jgi:hypothetical protein
MTGPTVHELELERLAAMRAGLRNELADAIQRQDQSRFRQSGADGLPVTRPMAEIEADIVKVDAQITDAERAQLQAELDAPSRTGRESTVGFDTELLLEAVEPVAGLGGVMLNGELGGPVGEQIVQLAEHVEMKLENRALLIDALAESHVNTKDTERQNDVLDEVRKADLDPVLRDALRAVDDACEAKRQALDEKIDTLQERFDERHAQKDEADRQALQRELDKQFEAMRAQLAAAEERERQRVIEERERQQASERAHGRDER